MLGLADRALVTVLPLVPRRVVRLVADRYIAGTELADACRAVRKLNGVGQMATIDVLGEETSTPAEARAIARTYRGVLQPIGRERLDANVSVKLTALGLKLDLAARERSGFVRIDMEDSSCTDDTLRLYRELREGGYDDVGVVIQAALRRTVADAEALADLRPNVRLCKGIYVEPEEIAFRDDEAIRRGYLTALNALLRADAYVALATHDEWLIREA